MTKDAYKAIQDELSHKFDYADRDLKGILTSRRFIKGYKEGLLVAMEIVRLCKWREDYNSKD